MWLISLKYTWLHQVIQIYLGPLNPTIQWHHLLNELRVDWLDFCIGAGSCTTKAEYILCLSILKL